MHEIRYVFRGLARSPRFWLLPALTLALVLLAGVALFACGWPARRAATIGPAEALGHD